MAPEHERDLVVELEYGVDTAHQESLERIEICGIAYYYLSVFHPYGMVFLEDVYEFFKFKVILVSWRSLEFLIYFFYNLVSNH